MKVEWNVLLDVDGRPIKGAEKPPLNELVLVTDTAGAVGLGVRCNDEGWATAYCLSKVLAWAERPEGYQPESTSPQPSPQSGEGEAKEPQSTSPQKE
jgi:hypothetical protein